jgi:hypothetical protein
LLCALALVTAAGAQPAQPATQPATTAPAATAPAKDLPKAATILQKASDAMGGADAMARITSLATTATGETPMGEMSLEVNSMKPDKFQLKQTMGGNDMTIVVNGKHGWMNAGGEYQLLPAEALSEMRDAKFHEALMTLAKDYKVIETVDQTDFSGKQAYKLRFADEGGGHEMFVFFDPETGLPLGRQSAQQTPMGEMILTTTFDQWEEVEGVKMFKRMSIDPGGSPMEFNFTKVEVNKLDPAMFAIPAEVQELIKAEESPASAPASQPADPHEGHGHE